MLFNHLYRYIHLKEFEDLAYDGYGRKNTNEWKKTHFKLRIEILQAVYMKIQHTKILFKFPTKSSITCLMCIKLNGT